jgi:hypothetical protein
MNILTYLSWVRKLWNTVVEIVKLIEETIPDDGAGKEKLAAFDIMLKAALDKADDIDESFDKLQPVAHDIVAVVVAIFYNFIFLHIFLKDYLLVSSLV